MIGASRDPAKLDAAMTRSLAAFPGTVVGINPRDADPPAGRYHSVADAVSSTGAPIDLAVLCVPAARSAAALTEAAGAGVRAAVAAGPVAVVAASGEVNHALAFLLTEAGVGVVTVQAGPGLLHADGLRDAGADHHA